MSSSKVARSPDDLPGPFVITFERIDSHTLYQGGITCGATDEPSKSSKAIDKRVIIDFCNKNVVIARFRDKNEVFIIYSISFYIFSISVLSIPVL